MSKRVRVRKSQEPTAGLGSAKSSGVIERRAVRHRRNQVGRKSLKVLQSALRVWELKQRQLGHWWA